MKLKCPTQERLNHALDYNPETGVFIWKDSKSNRAKNGSVAGCVGRGGYRYINLDGRPFPAHRLAWMYVYGEMPKYHIDHINRNPSDNRISNLRDVPQSFNCRNANISKNNTSGDNGVRKIDDRYQATIKFNYKHYYLGRFKTRDEAIAARRTAEKLLGFDELHGQIKKTRAKRLELLKEYKEATKEINEKL